MNALARAIPLLEERLAELEVRVREGEEDAWGDYLAALNTLVSIRTEMAPGRHGQLLSTAEMAARMGISTKTLLRHKSNGSVKPALQRGKLIRWRGDEAVPR